MTVINAYRQDVSAISYATAGFIVGGFSRISLGFKGFIVGSTLGKLFVEYLVHMVKKICHSFIFSN